MDGHHSFAMILVNLDIQPKFVQTADFSTESLSEAIAHKLHLFIFDACTLGCGGNYFHLITVFTEFLGLEAVYASPIFKVSGQ